MLLGQTTWFWPQPGHDVLVEGRLLGPQLGHLVEVHQLLLVLDKK